MLRISIEIVKLSQMLQSSLFQIVLTAAPVQRKSLNAAVFANALGSSIIKTGTMMLKPMLLLILKMHLSKFSIGTKLEYFTQL
jgi:hypothetical protein